MPLGSFYALSLLLITAFYDTHSMNILAHRDPDPLRRNPEAAPGDARPVRRRPAQDTVPHRRGRRDPWQLRAGQS